MVLFVSKLIKLLRKGRLYDINKCIYNNWLIWIRNKIDRIWGCFLNDRITSPLLVIEQIT